MGSSGGWKFRAGRFKVGFRVGFEIPSGFGLKIPQGWVWVQIEVWCGSSGSEVGSSLEVQGANSVGSGWEIQKL